MSAPFKKSPDRRQASPLMIAIVGAGIGAAATVFAPLFSQQSKACDRSDRRLADIENLVESGPKLKRLNSFISNEFNSHCGCYSEAIAEAQALAKDVAENAEATRTKPDNNKFADTQLRDDSYLPSGRSERPQVTIAPPAPVIPPKPNPSPILTTQTAPALATPPVDSKVPTGETIRDFTALGEQPPLVVTRNPTFADPSKPFDGEVGDSLIIKHNANYELRPPQNTTTTYRITRGTLTVDVDGQPYLSCKPGDEFRLYWKNAADFWTRTKDPKAELKIVNQETGKHLGISACEDALG